MLRYEEAINKVLLEAEERIGKLVLGDDANNASEAEVKTAHKDF